MSYTTKNNTGSIVSEMIVLLLIIVMGIAFLIYDIWYYFIPWIIAYPVDAIEFLIVAGLICYVTWKCAKITVEYFSHGAGAWIIEVIHAIRGTEGQVTQQKEIEDATEELYDADQSDINDAIAVLVKFGWKKSDASQRVYNIVMNSNDVDSVTKIVRKAMEKP